MTTYPKNKNQIIDCVLKTFKDMGWSTINTQEEIMGKRTPLGRTSKTDYILISRLYQKLTELNPEVSSEIIELGLKRIINIDKGLSLIERNKYLHNLIKDGVDIYIERPDKIICETIKIFDFDHIHNNDFLMASHFILKKDETLHEFDLVGFVNGLPLVLIFPDHHQSTLGEIYSKSIPQMAKEIPLLLDFNFFNVITNGKEAKVGVLNQNFGDYSEWPYVNQDREVGTFPLETLILGTCLPRNMLDIFENFIMFTSPAVEKIMIKNYQYLAVNKAIGQIGESKENEQNKYEVLHKLKPYLNRYSFVFFSRKILRKIPGRWGKMMTKENFNNMELSLKEYSDSSDKEVTELKRPIKNRITLKSKLNHYTREMETLLNFLDVDLSTIKQTTGHILNNYLEEACIKIKMSNHHKDQFIYNLKKIERYYRDLFPDQLAEYFMEDRKCFRQIATELQIDLNLFDSKIFIHSLKRQLGPLLIQKNKLDHILKMNVSNPEKRQDFFNALYDYLVQNIDNIFKFKATKHEFKIKLFKTSDQFIKTNDLKRALKDLNLLNRDLLEKEFKMMTLAKNISDKKAA